MPVSQPGSVYRLVELVLLGPLCPRLACSSRTVWAAFDKLEMLERPENCFTECVAASTSMTGVEQSPGDLARRLVQDLLSGDDASASGGPKLGRETGVPKLYAPGDHQRW